MWGKHFKGFALCIVVPQGGVPAKTRIYAILNFVGQDREKLRGDEGG